MLSSELRDINTGYGDKLTLVFEYFGLLDCVFNRALLLMSYGCDSKSDTIYTWLRAQLKDKRVRNNLRDFLDKSIIPSDQMCAAIIFEDNKSVFDMYYGLALIWYNLDNRTEFTDKLFHSAKKSAFCVTDTKIKQQYSNLFYWQRSLLFFTGNCLSAFASGSDFITKELAAKGAIDSSELVELMDSVLPLKSRIGRIKPELEIDDSILNLEDDDHNDRSLEYAILSSLNSLDDALVSAVYCVYLVSDLSILIDSLEIKMETFYSPPELVAANIRDVYPIFAILVKYRLNYIGYMAQLSTTKEELKEALKLNAPVPESNDFIYQISRVYIPMVEMYVRSIGCELDSIESLENKKEEIVQLKDSVNMLNKENRKVSSSDRKKDVALNKATADLDRLISKLRVAEDINKHTKEMEDKAGAYDDLLIKYERVKQEADRTASLEDRVIKLKREISDLEDKNLAMQIDLEECHNEMNLMLDSLENQSNDDTLVDVEYSLLNGKRVAIRGATYEDRDAIMIEIRKLAPGCMVNIGHGSMKNIEEGIAKCDLLLLLVRRISHVEYWKVRNTANAASVPLLYNNGNFSPGSCIRLLSDFFRKERDYFVSEIK